MLSTVVALPYELARLPLVVADTALQDRLADTSLPRLALGRAIASADQIAGALLRNPSISERGADRLERAGQRLAAVRLEQQADVRREQARAVTESGRQRAADLRHAAEERLAQGLQEADTVEAQGKQAAAVAAERTASAKRAAADRRASARAGAAERRREAATRDAAAKKKAARRSASATVDEARTAKSAAAQARDDADRLEDLTDARASQRKQD